MVTIVVVPGSTEDNSRHILYIHFEEFSKGFFFFLQRKPYQNQIRSPISGIQCFKVAVARCRTDDYRKIAFLEQDII